MLIFGGDTYSTFTFDTRDVAQIGGVANIKTSKIQMSARARFGVQSDYVARTFGSWIYLIDAKDKNLHVFSIQNQTWNSQALNQLGIEGFWVDPSHYCTLQEHQIGYYRAHMDYLCISR